MSVITIMIVMIVIMIMIIHFLPSSAAPSHFLSQFLLDGGSIGIPQHLYSLHTPAYSSSRAATLVPLPQVDPLCPASATRQDKDHPPFEDRSTVTAEAAVRHVDSSSLSEDDVFYN